MNTDSVFVLNQNKIPDKIQVIVDNIPDTIVVNGSVEVSNITEPHNYESQLDSLITIGRDVAEFGIGYSDTISNIAFPLIIAVFAFALPFLFSAINHINNKYDSTAIANMFESTPKYKTLWWSIAVNVGVMILYGVLSLLPFDSFHHWIGLISSYLFVVLGAWMVISVFLFMQLCIIYNKPYSVVDEIKRRYPIEKANAEKKGLKQSKKLKKIGETKSKSGKKVWEMTGSMCEISYSNSADFELINRLSEMCRYAIIKNDYNLYLSVWSKIYEIQKTEMKFDDTQNHGVSDDCEKNLTNSFLLKTCEYIGESVINVEIQGSLIRTWLQCFAHDKYPNYKDFHLLMRTMFKVAGKGYTSFIEKYFADSKYTFRYVRDLPQVLYIKGGDTSKRASEEKKSIEKWNEICDYHFVLAAFAYYVGLKTLPKQMMADERGMDMLPRNRQELLLTYVRCKSKMSSDGGYDNLSAEEMYGRRVDPDFIDTFAVLLFALLSDAIDGNYFLYVPNEFNDKIKSYQTLFYNIGEKFKKDLYIKSNYNKICQLNFNKAFEDSKRILINKPPKESFEDKLPELLEYNIKVHLHNQIMQLKNFNGDEMWKNASEDKSEVLEFGVCPIRLTKHHIAKCSEEEVLYHLRGVSEIVRNRALYLYMQILASWNCNVIKVQPDCISDKVNELVDGHPENYVLIDYDSNARNFLSKDYNDFRHPKCEGIDCVLSSCIGYLKDTFLYKQLEGRLFLICKKDLPALIRTSNEDVDVTFDDQSTYENNCMDLRMYIDSKFVIKYKKNVNITSFEVVPMKIN
ncbi:MAG: hypothetical protein IKP73_17170 [Bacteroidales bacterium]|nr:hypothetical protein [Bacteroidales bacterium]MBR6176857.1 hypothetical protein [Bacteroidales bacterium]